MHGALGPVRLHYRLEESMSEPDYAEDASRPADDGVTVSTTPVPLELRTLDDERVPEGQAGLGTFLGERLIARNTFPTEFVERLPISELFSEPVPLLFHVAVGGPGIQGTLYALVPSGPFEEESEETEPWAESVPRYEDTLEDVEGEEGQERRAMFPLGVLVRVARDRKFPDDLGAEAKDLLHTVLTGETHEVIDRVLDDLLNDS